MKLAIVITTYNRFDLLKNCIKSLVASNIPAGTEFIIVDDNSVEKIKPLFEPLQEKFPCDFWLLDRNYGIGHNLKLGFDVAVNKHASILCNLDPDTIVKPYWLDRLLVLNKQFQGTIVTGFNTNSGGRHKPHFEHNMYYLKRTIGGINMLFNQELYAKYIEPCLLEVDWDWQVCNRFRLNNIMFVVSKPSVIQHTGINEGMHVGPGIQPDVAEDF